MIEQEEKEKIKKEAKEFFEKMTILTDDFKVGYSSVKKNNLTAQGGAEDTIDVIDLEIKLDEPQILIGQQGQTLFEVQRILRMVLNRKLQKPFFLNLDINDYKKNKIEYLKVSAKELADQVALTKEEKSFPAMPAYERRIVHAELAQRTDIITESRGDGPDRHIVIKPK